MSFADSVAQDFTITDDTQTVTLKDNFGAVVATVAFGDPHVFSEKEVSMMDGRITYGDKRWLIGRTQLAANIVPFGGWSITDASGGVWELIGDATLDEFRISWECITRKAR